MGSPTDTPTAREKRAYLLGRFDALCDSGLKFSSNVAQNAAKDHFLDTGKIKLAYVDPSQAQMMGGGMPPMGGGMPPMTPQGGSPSPMPPGQPPMDPAAAGGQPSPSGGEVLLIGGQITNSDIKGFEKILNILKGLKMQYDDQAGMGADGAPAGGGAPGGPAPMGGGMPGGPAPGM